MGAAASVSNADVLPLIEQLGERPAALSSYLDNSLTRDKSGVLVVLHFQGRLSAEQAQDNLRYCHKAFNLMGFKVSQGAAEPVYSNLLTAIALRIPAEGVLQGQYVEIQQRDSERREFTRNYDNVEAQWKALRVIRQAATLA